MDLKAGDYVTLKRDVAREGWFDEILGFDGVRKVKRVVEDKWFVLENNTRECWYQREWLYKVTEINDLREKDAEFRQFVYEQLIGISTHKDIAGWICGGIASVPKKEKYKMHYKEIKKEIIIEFLRNNDKVRCNIMNRLMREDVEEVE